MVERFRDLTQNRLRRGVFRDLEELIMAIGAYIDRHNESPKPFIWTARAADILEKVKRCSPALSNCALDGLEQLLREKFPTKRPLPSPGGKLPAVNLVRYADDFVITGRTKELLEGEIKPLVEQFLQARGLELSPAKTVVTQKGRGFDFLGQNVRKYPNGKLLIKRFRLVRWTCIQAGSPS
jgi:Reverse transcriptase (RNA-dependent DNA polymerase)